MFKKATLPRLWYIIICILFIMIISQFIHMKMQTIYAEEQDSHLPAVIDLRDENEHEFYTALDGEWFFFEKKLIPPAEAYHYILRDFLETELLPSSFKEQTGDNDTFGTYVTRVIIPDEYVGRTLAVYIPFQYSAYKLYADQIEIASNGTVGMNSVEHRSEMAPKMGIFVPDSNEVLFTLQVSSFGQLRGGFENSIYIGDPVIVSQKFNFNIIWMLFVIGCIFIIGTFMLLFAWFRKNEKTFLIFGLFCISFAIRAIFAEPFYYTLVLYQINYSWGTRLQYLFSEASVLLLILLITEWYEKLFVKKFSKRLLRFIVGGIGSLLAITLFTEPIIFQRVYQFVLILSLFVAIPVVLEARNGIKGLEKKDIPNIIGLILVSLSLLNDYMFVQGWIFTTTLSLLTVGVYVVLQIFIMSKSFADKVQETEQLNHSLRTLNVTLDEQVSARTKELKLANEKLAHQAAIDSLTGLYNRHRFNTYIRQAFQEALDHQAALSIIMLDLDEFKKYNDYYGHIQGDQLLKAVIEITSQQLPFNSLYARYGGEEFIVVLPYMKLDEALATAERMRQAVEDAQLSHMNRSCGITTISLGVATLDQHTRYRNEVELVGEADRQLYRSKREGRNKAYAAVDTK
ncbi:diguanylate cyclase [Paenibacillus septentrionalis]|uniref:Diguanylate cyclase n=1 Tax=Paenibacillus septentrionalis TaxID=429342 RepID=A0ABW1V3Z2_9BACL